LRRVLQRPAGLGRTDHDRQRRPRLTEYSARPSARCPIGRRGRHSLPGARTKQKPSDPKGRNEVCSQARPDQRAGAPPLGTHAGATH
jgi:hypothetical protein